MRELRNTFINTKRIPLILICFFSFFTAIALFMNGDDYIWYYSIEDSELVSLQTPNGRFFSNKVTVWLVHSFFFRMIFVTVTFAALLIVVGKLLDFRNVTNEVKYYLSVVLFIFIPHSTYAETVNWISGYTNYIFSILTVFIYLIFMFRCLFDNYEPKPYSAFLFGILSFVGGLCVEHITIYDVFLAIAFLILTSKKNKKSRLHAICYLIGALMSCFLMFCNSIYSDIYHSGDSIGNRYFEFEFADIMQNAYSSVVGHYTKDYWIAAVILTIAFTVLYFKKDFGKNAPKYLRVCMAICWLYSSYSVFTMCISDLRVFTPAMRTVAIETAFSFIYVVAIAYLIYVFIDKDGKIRSYLYLISTFLLTAPFLFISPATPRCFFANYMFWILLCGEILTAAIKTINPKHIERMKGITLAFAFCSVLLILTACLTNKYINTLRFDYIKEQVEDKKNRSIKLILLPYTEFHHDDLEDGLLTSSAAIGDIKYSDYILKYYDIELDKDQKYSESTVSPYAVSLLIALKPSYQ